MAAYLAYVALHSFVFTFQSTTLLKEWNGGDYSALVKNPAAVDWSYGLVNLLILPGPRENDSTARCGLPAGIAARFTIGCHATSG